MRNQLEQVELGMIVLPSRVSTSPGRGAAEIEGKKPPARPQHTPQLASLFEPRVFRQVMEHLPLHMSVLFHCHPTHPS
jgi:hypothetical protein